MINFFNIIASISNRTTINAGNPTGKRLYLAAGQSNTTGVIDASSRPQWFIDLGDEFPTVQFMDNPSNIFGNYTLNSAGKYSYEMYLYKLLAEYKDEVIYSIHQDESGTSISPEAKETAAGYWTTRLGDIPAGKKKILPDWESRITTGLNYLNTNSINYDLKCVIWHQGESDSFGQGPALYYDELKALIAEIRTHTNTPNLKWILGGINTSSTSYNQIVQDAKIQIASEDSDVFYVPVLNGTQYLNADSLHFNASGGIDLAEGIFDVIKDF